MIVHFNGLDKPTHLDGIWRYPDDEVAVSATLAERYIKRGIAVAAEKLENSHLIETPNVTAGRVTAPALYFNGQPVERFPERCGFAVSVIVPLYRSADYIEPLLDSLQGSDPTPFETIFVSDGDGQPDVPGKLIVLSKNCGYPAAVNTGARYAAGRHICLLNADVKVHSNWLASMAALLESAPDIGAVGNRNLDRHGRIDSVGSEFSYASGNFEHILLGAENVSGPVRDNVAERDMITAACLLIRGSVWRELKVFDEEYRLAYFEDSDLCMRIREAGLRILYCPHSVVTHHKNHSGIGQHRYYRDNKRRFHSRWVETGCVDKFARSRGRKTHTGQVVACYIVLNEEEYIQASLESVYPLADRIVIVEGGNDYAVAAGLCGPDKRSTDATVERIAAFRDPEKKIELIRGAWRDKAEQRQAYAKGLEPGDWMLLMDGDEVFFEDGLWRLSYLMHKQNVIQPLFRLFWNDFETLGTGVWDQFPQVKAVRWREGYHYRDHNCPCDASGRLIVQLGDRHAYVPERLYAHYAWVKPIQKLRRKAAYYERQPGARDRMRPNYIDDVFLPWRRHPIEIVSSFGTHPFGGGGTAAFLGPHPQPIQKRLTAGEFSWVE